MSLLVAMFGACTEQTSDTSSLSNITVIKYADDTCIIRLHLQSV